MVFDAVFSRRVARQFRYEHEGAIYCGGGLWYSRNGTASWTRRTDAWLEDGR